MARSLIAVDAIASSLTATPTAISIAMWVRRSGLQGLMRYFDKNDGGDIRCTGSTVSGFIQFRRAWSGGEAVWENDQGPLDDTDNHLCITYDGSSTANDPVLYIDNTNRVATMNENTAPSGTLVNGAGPLIFGNRADFTTGMVGDLWEIGVWNRILTLDEIRALALRRFSPLFFPVGLVEYIPCIRDNISRVRAAPTLTGTTVATHRRMIYPSLFGGGGFTGATAASSGGGGPGSNAYQYAIYTQLLDWL